MKEQLAYAMAFAFVVGAVGLSIVPSVAAVPSICDEDYLIDGTKQARPLDPDEVEVGRSDVSAPGDEVMTVNLTTNNDKLEFGIFELDGDDCDRSDNVSSNCDQDVTLDTTGGNPTDAIDCILEAPPVGTLEFYVVFEHIEDNNGLEYTVESA